mmetsp:Transcript_24401/g.27305  ORF Transcript_24401/g.27305 Transcript_24401/m.27305 type:complete len:1715 (+) Transcript_24401:126-5270(+)
MTDASNSREHEEKIKEFVKSGNKKRLHTLLGCELKKSYFNNNKEVGSVCSVEISSSTPKAVALLDLLHYRFSSRTQRQQQHRTCIDNEGKFCMTVDEIFQALLLIDPSYITPWKALDEFASAFQNNPVIPVLHCVSSIEEFLLKAKFSFGPSRNQSDNQSDNEKGIPQCVKDLMIQFVQKLTNYLLLVDEDDKNNVGNNSKQLNRTRYEAGEPIFYKLISELLCTVLIVCRDWCNVLFNNIVSIVHLRRPHPSRIKIWLQLAQLSLLRLTNKHIKRIAEILRDQLCESPNDMPPRKDIPLIVSIVVEMVNPLSYSTYIVDEDPTLNVKKLWRNIILVLFHQISIHRSHQCYIASESNLKKGMNKWSANSLKSLTAEIINYSHSIVIPNEDDVIPFWFSWNLLSICFEVLNAEEKQSTAVGLVGMIMVDHSPQGSEISVNVLTKNEYQSILQFALGTTSDINSLLDERIEEMCYNSNDGSLFFQDGDGEKIDCLSACGNVIMRSLLLVECNTSHGREDENRSSAIPRALRLINMVDDIVANCPDEQLLQASAFAVIAKTVAYFEVPKFRHLLEHKIKQDISKPSRLQACHYSTLRLIVTSAINIGNNDDIIERWMDIFEGDLSSSDVAHLCHMFAHLRIARAKILSCSTKLLAPMYCYWRANEIENEDVTKPEVQQRIIDGIVCLLELVRINHWNKNEIAAWTILSDTLVLDVPHLPIESRRWLYQKLIECVTADTFSVNTLEHLFRSTTVRMSFLVERDPSTSILITQAQQIQEVVSLHRLITVVLRSLATVDKHSGSRHIILAQGREAFLRSILSYKKGLKSRDQSLKGILKQMYSMKDSELCSFTLCWLLFLELNFYLLDLTMIENSKSKTCDHLVNSSTGKGNTNVSKLVEEIKGIEGRELKIGIGDNSIYKSLIPSWLQKKTAVFRSDNPNSIKSTDTFNPILPCFDLTLEFLFLVPLPVREAHDFDDPLAWKIMAATGFLISRKQSAKTECTLSSETIKQTAEPFLSISSWLIRDAIRLDCDLMVVEDLLGPTVSYCRALYLTLDSTEPPDCAGIIRSLWNLYQTVASESACVKFIKYLESHISDNRTSTVQRDNDMFSLASVYSENDVDETVQQLRLSCLQPFLKCLPFVNSSEETGLIFSECFVVGLLGALVTDLRTGLDGNSGGLRHELYITYCMSIEECASLLFNHNMLSFDCSIFLLFKEITETLVDILTTFPLHDAVLFRTTFILAAAVFPSMCRDMMRRSFCGSNPSVEKVDEMFSIDLVLFDRVLDDCIEILIRWTGLREPYLIPWLDIAGPDHADLKNNGTNDYYKLDNRSTNISLDASQTRDDEIPRFVHVPSPPIRDHQSDSCPTTMRQRIRFYTKEVWSWALSCSLLGFEQKWLESERTILILNGSVRRAEVEISSTNWKKFFEVRKRELQNSLTNINRFFHTSTGFARRDQRGNQVVLDMMAMNLPSAPRLRLCCLIECVSRVLIHSIKCSCSFLCGGATNTTQELSIFESLCCLSAWLSPNKDNPDRDFSAGIFKMLAIASRKRPPGESTSQKCDTAELLARISQVSDHVHQLYLALKNFQKSLRGLSTDEGRGCQTELIGSFFDDKNTKNEILRLTVLKLHSLQKVMPTEFQVKSLPDFPSDNANEVIPQSHDRKRTRRGNKKTTLKSREKSIRAKNRNKVVDIFMNMDQDNDSAQLKSTRDAYTDLEDFLVEG